MYNNCNLIYYRLKYDFESSPIIKKSKWDIRYYSVPYNLKQSESYCIFKKKIDNGKIEERE